MLLLRAHSRGESSALGYWYLCQKAARQGMEAAGHLEIPFARLVPGACAWVPLRDGLLGALRMG